MRVGCQVLMNNHNICMYTVLMIFMLVVYKFLSSQKLSTKCTHTYHMNTHTHARTHARTHALHTHIQTHTQCTNLIGSDNKSGT